MSILNFELDDKENREHDVKNVVDEYLKKMQEVDEPTQYFVVLHNDPVNGVDFVANAIMKVFDYGLSRSIWLMLKAHVTGSSVLWIGSSEKASEKSHQLRLIGPDPNMIKKGAAPLTITVERQF